MRWFRFANYQVTRTVLLVQLFRIADDVGLIDLLRPILWFDFLNGYQHRTLLVVQNVHDVFGYFFGESDLLLFGFSGPELYGDADVAVTKEPRRVDICCGPVCAGLSGAASRVEALQHVHDLIFEDLLDAVQGWRAPLSASFRLGSCPGACMRDRAQTIGY